MTDLLEPYTPARDDDLPPLTTTTEPAPFLAWLMAAGLAGAGIIHLAMAPSHMAEWTEEGVAFLGVALLQLGLAVALVMRPRRWMAALALVSSAVFIGAWWYSRVNPMPFGPAEHYFEEASFVDVTCVILEGLVVAVALLALVRPRATASWGAEAKVIASALPIAALVLGVVAVGSPSASEHSHGAVRDDLGLYLLSNGHHHEITENVLDPATQAELDRQMDLTRQVADRYPTVADAEAAGYRRAGPYSPGLGAHYTAPGVAGLNPDGIVDDDDVLNPQTIIYDGNEPTSRVAGFMYYSTSPTEPAGFAGSNDTWHTHSNVCIKFLPDGSVDSPLGADRANITEEDCAAVGGALLPFTQWMVHVWSVPGYDNVNGGVFAEVNPRLACSDGTYFTAQNPDKTVPPINNCRSGAPGEPRHALPAL